MKKYDGNTRKYEGNMKEYDEICLGPFSLNQSGASISPEPSLWTNEEPAFLGPFSLNQSGASIFRIIQPELIRSQHC